MRDAPRSPSASRAFATLNSCVLYADEALPELATAAGDAGKAEDDEEDDDVEASRVLFFYSASELAKEQRSRMLGSVFGVAEFAKFFDATSPIRSVQLQKKRMLWTELEPGFRLHIAVDLPRTRGHSRDLSAQSASDPASSIVSDDALRASMKRAYRYFRLRHGSIARGVHGPDPAAFRSKLVEHWQSWCERFVASQASTVANALRAAPMSTACKASSFAQLAPLMSQFSAVTPGYWHVVLYNKQVLHASQQSESYTGPDVTQDDLEPIVSWLAEQAASRPIATRGIPESLADTKREGRASKWASYLTPSMPSIPIPSLPQVTSLPSVLAGSLSSSPSGRERASGSSPRKQSSTSLSSWSLRNVSWTTFGRSAGTAPSSARETPPSRSETASVHENYDSTGTGTGTGTAIEDVVTDTSVLDESALLEAMGNVTPPAEQSQPVAEIERPVHTLFVGPHADQASVVMYDRGNLVLALVKRSDQAAGNGPDEEVVSSKAERLLEAVETLLLADSSPAPRAETMAHPYVVKQGGFSDASHWLGTDQGETWSGRDTGDAQLEQAVLSLISQPSPGRAELKERCIKLNNLGWIVEKRDPGTTDPSAARPLKHTVAVLPLRVGRDGSLVDVGEEMARMERTL